MKASLVLEAIGHGESQRIRLYRAVMREAGLGRVGDELLGGLSNRWGVWDADTGSEIYGRTDYSQSNSKGSRGVRIWYTLQSGKRYRVRDPKSWTRSEEYCCHVTAQGDIERE